MKPGEDIVEQGVRDIAAGMETIPALLVAIGATRLRLNTSKVNRRRTARPTTF